MKVIQSERRGNRRYHLELDVRYKVLRRGGVLFEGTGKTVDISTRGLMFATPALIPVGAQIEITVSWPIRVSGIYPIQLSVMGYVVRSDAGGTGVRMTIREFQNAAMRPALVQAAGASLHMM
jgi:hypothetical protein